MTRRLAAVLKPRFNRLAGNRSAKAGRGPQPTRNSRTHPAAVVSVLREFLKRGWPLHSFGSGPEGDVDFFGQRNMEISHGGSRANLP